MYRLSGLSPFLGDDNNGTLNNILACQWNFEEDEFIDISKEAKDFISKMLIVDKRYSKEKELSLTLEIKGIVYWKTKMTPSFIQPLAIQSLYHHLFSVEHSQRLFI